MGAITYTILNSVVLVLAVALVWRWRERSRRVLVCVGACLIVLTAVFDSMIVAFDIVAYDPTLIIGWRIGAAPIEDFFYTVAVVVLIPALWNIFNRTKEASVWRP